MVAAVVIMVVVVVVVSISWSRPHGVTSKYNDCGGVKYQKNESLD